MGSFIASFPGFVTDLIDRYGGGGSDPFAPSDDPTISLIGLVGTLLSYVTQAFMMGGITNFCLKVVRGQPYSFGDIFSGAPWFFASLGIMFLGGLGILFGLLLLIVPGVFLTLAWSFALPIAIDRNLGPIAALGESFRLTEGHRLSLLVLWLAFLGITLLGLCACGVGVVVSAAVTQLALVWAYCRVSGTA